MCQTLLCPYDTIRHGSCTQVEGTDKFSDDPFTVKVIILGCREAEPRNN